MYDSSLSAKSHCAIARFGFIAESLFSSNHDFLTQEYFFFRDLEIQLVCPRIGLRERDSSGKARILGEIPML